MRIPSLLLAGALGVLVAMPLPLLAWWIAERKGLERGRAALLVVAAGIASGVLGTTWLLSTVEDTGQHSLGAGFARFTYGIGFPICQLMATLMALVLTLSSRRRAGRVTP